MIQNQNFFFGKYTHMRKKASLLYLFSSVSPHKGDTSPLLAVPVYFSSFLSLLIFSYQDKFI